ncbi:MAG: TetR/AcrR family transcriptional regulator [Verrucomicrobia bacterium]|nr:TetR/AcrR family transcriptional regulator [Verrucomicrobiota bacterium]
MPLTPKPGSAKSRPAKSRAAKDSYHHGNLRQVLIETTLRLIAKVRPENVTVRAVAKLAGVSSGAPFRHFPNRSALMTAVAEEAMLRLQEEVEASLKKAADLNPLLRFRAIGEAWIRWAVRHPSHFKVISDRSLIDSDASAAWRRRSKEIQAEGIRLLQEAQLQGLIAEVDIRYFHLAGRALVYGLARMYSDGHFASFGLDEGRVDQIGQSVLDAFFRVPVRPTTNRLDQAREAGPSPIAAKKA